MVLSYEVLSFFLSFGGWQQRRCSGVAAVLQRRCSGVAAALQRRCSGVAAALQRRCKKKGTCVWNKLSMASTYPVFWNSNIVTVLSYEVLSFFLSFWGWHNSGVAAALQRRCSGVAAALQRRCNGVATALQRHCNGAAKNRVRACEINC